SAPSMSRNRQAAQEGLEEVKPVIGRGQQCNQLPRAHSIVGIQATAIPQVGLGSCALRKGARCQGAMKIASELRACLRKAEWRRLAQRSRQLQRQNISAEVVGIVHHPLQEVSERSALMLCQNHLIEVRLIGKAQFASDRDAFPLRSEEHTSELQSRENLVCRLLLEKKKKQHK